MEKVHISEVIDILRRGGLDVSPSLVRDYENEELLNPEKTESGYRLYSLDDLEQIRFILTARILNIPIKNIKFISNLISGKSKKNSESIYREEELERYLQEIIDQSNSISRDFKNFAEKIIKLSKK